MDEATGVFVAVGGVPVGVGVRVLVAVGVFVMVGVLVAVGGVPVGVRVMLGVFVKVGVNVGVPVATSMHVTTRSSNVKTIGALLMPLEIRVCSPTKPGICKAESESVAVYCQFAGSACPSGHAFMLIVVGLTPVT